MWLVSSADYETTLQKFQKQFNGNERAKKLVKNWNRLILLSATDTGSKYRLVVKDDEMAEVQKASVADEEADGLVHLETEETVLKDIFSGIFSGAQQALFRVR